MPTLPYVLPVYAMMKRHLQHHARTNSIQSIRIACDAGLLKLEKYYSGAKANHFNILASVLHPHIGLKFFAAHNESEKEIAQIIFEHAYAEYKQRYEERSKVTKPPVPSEKPKAKSFLHDICDVPMDAASDLDSDPTVVDDECARFYRIHQTHDLGAEDDPLSWWKYAKASADADISAYS
ncbi:hypothetical protein BDZ89DRAFT_1049695 [Hymenopellis radicata]|nr:hypothetical protein BDZ89DRAFT_1049695 [Hymenopellis radicata]